MNSRNLYKDVTKYNSFADTSFSWSYIEKPAFTKYLSKIYSTKLKVLEIGCGGGRIIDYLISKGIKPENITGLDVTPELLSIARKKLPRVNFVKTNVLDATFTPNSFDLIVSNMVFHHLNGNELTKTFNSVYKWLKKGGYFFYITSHPLNVISGKLEQYLKRSLVYKLTPWGENMPHNHRPVCDYINQTINSGFTVKIVDEPHVVPEGKVDQKEYNRYSACPSRLVILAIK